MGATGAAVNKGVGGYRPTINWRDITIRKKNVADKQVLACIVLSGIVIIVVGVVITILGFLVISSQCPFEWVRGSGSCYYFAQHNATWEDGQAYCENQGAALLDLHSTTETTFVTDNMQGRSWLGLQRKKDGDFKWISGAKYNYTQWQANPGVPSSPATATERVVIEDTGDWVISPSDDEEEAYVICEYVPGYNPFVLIGPVVIFCGVVVLILSIEVCIRRREFMEKNPEVMMPDDDDDREVDAGLINYGYGNFEGDVDSTPVPTTTTTGKKVSWTPTVGSSSPTKSLPESIKQSYQQIPSSTGLRQLSPIEDTRPGPLVHVVPASLPNSPSLAAVNNPPEENSNSQEQLELLLSPKTLE